VRQATRTARQTRLRTLKDLDAAALQLSTVCTYLIDPAYSDAEVRTAIYAAIPHATITAAVETIEALARPSDVDIQPELIARYTLVRRFLPTLLRTIAFQGTAAGRPVLTALTFLQRIEGMRDPDLRQAPREVVPRPWRRFVFLPRREVDRPAYTLCVLEQLQMHLRRHDLFVTPSDRWGDLRTTLLQGADWEAQRANVCRVLNLPLSPAEAVERLRIRDKRATVRDSQLVPAAPLYRSLPLFCGCLLAGIFQWHVTHYRRVVIDRIGHLCQIERVLAKPLQIFGGIRAERSDTGQIDVIPTRDQGAQILGQHDRVVKDHGIGDQQVVFQGFLLGRAIVFADDASAAERQPFQKPIELLTFVGLPLNDGT